MKALKAGLLAGTAAFAFSMPGVGSASVPNLLVEGGGTAQVFALGNGNFLGLWGFDNRGNENELVIASENDLRDGFTSGTVVGFYNGSTAVNGGAQEFAPIDYSFTVAADTRLFDSLWVEWTGGFLVYNFEGQTRTMDSGTITRQGDPFAPTGVIPLPAAGWLLLGGLAGLGVIARRKRAAA